MVLILVYLEKKCNILNRKPKHLLKKVLLLGPREETEAESEPFQALNVCFKVYLSEGNIVNPLNLNVSSKVLN